MDDAKVRRAIQHAAREQADSILGELAPSFAYCCAMYHLSIALDPFAHEDDEEG